MASLYNIPMANSSSLSALIQARLAHLYLSPLESCNLHCKICYTAKTKARLTLMQLQEFVTRYRAAGPLETVTLCGGEVFLLDYLPQFVDWLTQQEILVQIITNGTINRLAEIKQPNLVNLIVSLDGLPADHEANRGSGTWAKSLAFLRQAGQLGFHREIFTVVTQLNLATLAKFKILLHQELGEVVPITFHPRKPLAYLNSHPSANQLGQVAGFEFLTAEQLKQLFTTESTFPPRDLGCFQIAVQSNGLVYGCCEGIRPLGKMTDSIAELMAKLTRRVVRPAGLPATCLGCSEPDFGCGFLPILAKLK